MLARHNDLKHEWHSLCSKALTPSHVSDEPLIFSSQDVRTVGDAGAEARPELRGDTSAHGFWRRGTTAIFDARVTDTDAPSYRGTAPIKVLEAQERRKKDQYLEPCLARRRSFTPLVFSVDGMRAPEATAACKRVAALLALKWHRPYSVVAGYVRSRLSIALVRASNRCLRSDRNPIWKSREPSWDAGDGLPLYK